MPDTCPTCGHYASAGSCGDRFHYAAILARATSPPKPDDTREDFIFLREVALPKLGENYYKHTEAAAREALARIEKRLDTLIIERSAR